MNLLPQVCCGGVGSQETGTGVRRQRTSPQLHARLTDSAWAAAVRSRAALNKMMLSRVKNELKE